MSGVTYLEIEWHRYEYYTQLPSGGEWDNGSTAANIQILGAKKVDEYEYDTIAVKSEIEVGQTVYLVWADYNTGDSFGSYCNQVEFLGIELTYPQAELLRVEYEEKTGYDVPWNGYFESLNSINITPIVVSDNKGETQ